MYILNEKEYIGNILASKKKPDDLSMGYLITLIAKYCYSDRINADELSDMIKKKLSEFDLENYQEYQYHNKIIATCQEICTGSTEHTFREREFIPIYESELAFIDSLPNDRQKKLMFTLFTIARYMDCDGWINKKTAKEISEVFRLSNVTLTSDKRNELLHELYRNGHISFGKKINNLNIRVKLTHSGKVGYPVKEFHNIGYQYIGHFKKGYKQCCLCGKPIKITNNRMKYCSNCYKKANKSDAKNRMKKYRETPNVTF